MSISKKASLFGIVIVVIGISLMAFIILQNFMQREALAQSNPSPAPIVSQEIEASVNTSERAVTGIPVQMDIASIGMSLDVRNGEYNRETGEWTLADDAAFYATPTSPLSSAPANTLIYGHNTQQVFSSLFGLKEGDQAVVKADNGYEFVYTFAETKRIEPTDVAILNVGDKPQLTLQTCTGLFDQYRQMFIFYLTDYRETQ